MAIVEAIPDIIPPLVAALPELIDSLLTTLLDNIPVLLDAAVDLFMALVDAIPILIPVLVDAIPQIVDSVVDALIEAIPVILDGALKLFFAIVDAVPLILPQLLVALVQIVASVQLNLASKLGKVFKSIWDSIVVIFKNVGTHFANWCKNGYEGIKNAFSGVTKFFSGIWDSIKKIFSKVGTVIGNAITNTVKTAVNGVLSTATKIINGFINAINTAISVINAIPGVNIKKLNTLSVPKLARGGVVNSATLAMIGEDGKEAVVPLEKNTEWLDKLAERLGSMLGGDGTPIVLQVDGKTFGQISVDSINQITRQRGSLPLRLS
jgi:phage-related protein